jgi:ribonuclease Z
MTNEEREMDLNIADLEAENRRLKKIEQAAQTATKAGVKTLILTHYVPGIGPGQEDEWRAIAAAHFSGDIVLGDDLTSVTI